MKIVLDNVISKQFLLEKNSQETYLEYYLGIPVKKGLFKSPLRIDNSPTCSFYRNSVGDIILKDFSGQFYGNFIKVVMFKFNLNYAQALQKIAIDFGYIKGISKQQENIKISNTKFTPVSKTIIQIQNKKFDDYELDWWKQFGITKEILNKFNVFSCKAIFLNGKLFTLTDRHNMAFGYYKGLDKDGDELWRIYFPNGKKTKLRFLSNWKSNKIQGSSQLPKSGNLLIITKSLKDCMTLYSLGITAIAPISENLFLTEYQFSNIKKRFKNIYVLYDNDLAGISNMNKIRKNFDVKCLWIPRKYKAKDISDFYKIYGETKTKEFIKLCLKKLKN